MNIQQVRQNVEINYLIFGDSRRGGISDVCCDEDISNVYYWPVNGEIILFSVVMCPCIFLEW